MHLKGLQIRVCLGFSKKINKNQRQMKDKTQIKGCIPRIIFLVIIPRRNHQKKNLFEWLILEDLLGKHFSQTGLKRVLQITKG